MAFGKAEKSLRLHCMLLHWFWLPTSPLELVQHLWPVFAETKPFVIESHYPALFGKQNDIPVHRLAPSPVLKWLHGRVLDVVDQLGAEHTEPCYIGSGYAPHVTTQGERSFPPGSTHTVRALYVVETSSPSAPRTIAARIPLCE